MDPLAIYIHVPFCARKCAYCDFASFSGREADWRRYFEALWAELESWSPRLSGYEVASVFFGGGTPTLVPGEYIVETLSRARAIAPFTADAEITLEGNPGTLTPEKLAAYRSAGVNRLSLGAQSFDDRLLRSLGRIHTAAQIGEAVRLARTAGFGNINLDLMYALPGQATEQWLHTLDAAVSLEVQHISAYSLIVEEGTPMADRVRRGEAVIPDDDAVNAMQRAAIDRLAAAGYGRYEISNYARPGIECRHNLTYWRRGDYLGLGCAAHSMLRETRFCNPASLDAYLSGEREVDKQVLTREDAMEETVLLSTRTARGIDLEKWRRDYGTPFAEGREEIIARLSAAGYIEADEGNLRLTRRGFEVQDAVVLALLEEQGR
ncbi:MAG: radical SAM family heme chaperone HemW [Clostridia bacterium]|nr:radical SAM family heme chaperone HemW [Clostridia bacterium]